MGLAMKIMRLTHTPKGYIICLIPHQGIQKS